MLLTNRVKKRPSIEAQIALNRESERVSELLNSGGDPSDLRYTKKEMAKFLQFVGINKPAH